MVLGFIEYEVIIVEYLKCLEDFRIVEVLVEGNGCFFILLSYRGRSCRER